MGMALACPAGATAGAHGVGLMGAGTYNDKKGVPQARSAPSPTPPAAPDAQG